MSESIRAGSKNAKWLLVGKAESLAAIHPLAPNTSADVDGFGRILWLRPEQWLLMDPSSPRKREPSDSQQADQQGAGPRRPPGPQADGVVALPASGRFVEIEISGSRATEVLALGCSLDLSRAAFPVGACAGTRIETVPVYLWHREEGCVSVLVERPLSDYLDRWLRRAATGLAQNAGGRG